MLYGIFMEDDFLRHLASPQRSHAFLLVGEINDARELANKAIKILDCPAGDYFSFEESIKIGIKEIRQLEKWFLLYPVRGVKIALINYASLSLVASHALLKILEEPPDYGLIILLAENRRLVLPTIASRCQIYRLKPAKGDYSASESATSMLEISRLPLNEKFKLAKDLSEREDLLGLVDKWIFTVKNESRQEKYQWLKYLLTARQRLLTSHINKRLLLDELFIKLKAHDII